MSILNLPTDVLDNIFKRLRASDLRNLILTCKALKEIICNDNGLWRKVFEKELLVHNCYIKSTIFSLNSYNRCRISYNWRNGIFRDKILIHRNTSYMPWLRFHNSEHLMVSLGSELFCFKTYKGQPQCDEPLWKIDVPKVYRNDVRTNDISQFCIKDDIIVCGNRDGCLSIYKQFHPKHRPVLLHHVEDCHGDGRMEVSTASLLDADTVVTGAQYSSILRIWKWQDEADVINIKDIDVPSGIGIRCVATNKQWATIGLNGNSKPLLIDVTTGSVLMNLAKINYRQMVRDIQWHDENTVTYVTHSGLLQSIDTRSHQLIYNAMDPFQCTLYCLRTDTHNAIVVGSSEYSRCVLYDRRNQKCHIQMYFTQNTSSPVYSLDFDSTKLIAAADKSVAMLNFNVNVNTAKHKDYSHAFDIVVT